LAHQFIEDEGLSESAVRHCACHSFSWQVISKFDGG
jgi:hypothetical protein